MEEKFGKSVRTPYIVTYSIFIAFGLLFLVGIGVLILLLAEGTARYFGLFWLFLGLFLSGASIGWLVYFIKMPEYSITYKDGKLNFRNKLECTPDRLENIVSGSWGLDGAIFSYGRVIVTVDGEKYKFNFIFNQQEVVNRLYAIRNEYVAAKNAAYFAAQAQAQAQAAQTEAASPAVESAAVAEETAQEAVVEQNIVTGTEENNG